MQEDEEIEDQENGKDLKIQEKKIKSNVKSSFRKLDIVKEINMIMPFFFSGQKFII